MCLFLTLPSSPEGMGFHIAYQIACKNAKVYIGARSSEKAEAAIREMRNKNPSIGENNLVPFVADLGDIREVRAAAEGLLQTESKLDILINNAAV
jgi:NAD(P)-dependent dehydrogenase (short-subunit alcohol dehydrogenase family)